MSTLKPVQVHLWTESAPDNMARILSWSAGTRTYIGEWMRADRIDSAFAEACRFLTDLNFEVIEEKPAHIE